MVYQGKPSRGCQMCRTRRIKCDETKPTCKQCAKSRRTCPGYKDEFDLVFRNETLATERRAKKANQKALARIESGSSSTEFKPETSVTLTDLAPSVAFENFFRSTSFAGQPQTSLTEQASCYFISNYVLLPRQGSTRGFLEYVVPLLKSGKVAECFQYAFEACAIASLGNGSGSGSGVEFEKLGLNKYTQAISATYKAVRDPSMAKQDATLASVLLLGLYENITAKQLGMLAWGSHIEGAIQLVKARGRKQLRTKTGVALFIAARTQMIIHTLSTGKPPVMGLDWWVNQDSIRDHWASQCQKFNIRTGEIRAEVNRLMIMSHRNQESIQSMEAMIKMCQSVDQECLNWAASLPEHFQCRAITWEDHVPDGDYKKAEVFPGRVDGYQDLWVASIWNMMRCARIVLASIVARCTAWSCSPVDYRTTPEYAAAARICVENITDIIASVPYQLNWFSTRKHLLDRASLSGFACGLEDAQKCLAGYFLTWPLACVQGQDYTTDSQRTWVQGRLQFIGSRLGVRYALMLSQLNVRTPSMLIRRDGLMATSQTSNFETLLSNKAMALSPIQQQGTGLQDAIQRQKDELVTKVMGNSGKIDEWTAKTWLQMQHLSTTVPGGEEGDRGEEMTSDGG